MDETITTTYPSANKFLAPKKKKKKKPMLNHHPPLHIWIHSSTMVAYLIKCGHLFF